MEDSARIIEKVKKLLELASSPNEAEAKLAYKRAQDLIAKYSLDLSGAQAVEEIQTVPYKTKIKETPGFSDEFPWIAFAIVKPFGVYVLIKGQGIELVGFKTNVIVASHALDCILNQCFIDYKRGYRENRSITFAPLFWKGASAALRKRFAEANEEEKGLIVYDKVRDYMKNKFQATGYQNKTLAYNQKAWSAGTNAAKNAQIRLGVTAANGGKLLS